MKRTVPRMLAGLVAAVALVLPAQALAANSCNYSDSQVFASYGDLAFYYLVPGGKFDGGSSWSRSGDATVISSVSPLGGTKSMRLRSGGSVTSPSFCVTYDSPTARFLLKDPGSSSATILVESIWTTSTGIKMTVPIGKFSGSSAGWRLSPIMLIWANLSAYTDNKGTWKMQLRFTSLSGEWTIDDVYIDPFRRV